MCQSDQSELRPLLVEFGLIQPMSEHNLKKVRNEFIQLHKLKHCSKIIELELLH
jgi:hypothetical protein